MTTYCALVGPLLVLALNVLFDLELFKEKLVLALKYFSNGEKKRNVKKNSEFSYTVLH